MWTVNKFLYNCNVEAGANGGLENSWQFLWRQILLFRLVVLRAVCFMKVTKKSMRNLRGKALTLTKLEEICWTKLGLPDTILFQNLYSNSTKPNINSSCTELFGLAKARLKLCQRWSLEPPPTTHHTNFWGTSRQRRRLIFGIQPNLT